MVARIIDGCALSKILGHRVGRSLVPYQDAVPYPIYEVAVIVPGVYKLLSDRSGTTYIFPR